MLNPVKRLKLRDVPEFYVLAFVANVEVVDIPMGLVIAVREGD